MEPNRSTSFVRFVAVRGRHVDSPIGMLHRSASERSSGPRMGEGAYSAGAFFGGGPIPGPRGLGSHFLAGIHSVFVIPAEAGIRFSSSSFPRTREPSALASASLLTFKPVWGGEGRTEKAAQRGARWIALLLPQAMDGLSAKPRPPAANRRAAPAPHPGASLWLLSLGAEKVTRPPGRRTEHHTDVSRFSRGVSRTNKSWIPAFAGMTRM